MRHAWLESCLCSAMRWRLQEFQFLFLLCAQPTQHLYPELGVDLGERAYGADCRLFIQGQGVNWPVIRATLFDEFVVAHTLGWWGKVRACMPLLASNPCGGSTPGGGSYCSRSSMLVPICMTFGTLS